MHKFEFFYVISQSETRNNKKKVIFIMDLTGRVIAVLPANSGVSARTGNPWMSQEYVIEVPGQYPRKCLFRIFGEDRIKQFNIQMGEDRRWFNEIRAYNVTRGVAPVAGATPFPPQQAAAPNDSTSPFPPAQEPAGEGSADDLPF